MTGNNTKTIQQYSSQVAIGNIKDLKRRVWRYQRCNQNPYVEEEQTTQWPKEKG
jgi:hypothetical protein